MENISEVIKKIRKNETVICLDCKKGKYVTTPGYLQTSHCYWCDKCGNTIHITSKSVIVE